MSEPVIDPAHPSAEGTLDAADAHITAWSPGWAPELEDAVPDPSDIADRGEDPDA